MNALFLHPQPRCQLEDTPPLWDKGKPRALLDYFQVRKSGKYSPHLLPPLCFHAPPVGLSQMPEESGCQSYRDHALKRFLIPLSVQQPGEDSLVPDYDEMTRLRQDGSYAQDSSPLLDVVVLVYACFVEEHLVLGRPLHQHGSA